MLGPSRDTGSEGERAARATDATLDPVARLGASPPQGGFRSSSAVLVGGGTLLASAVLFAVSLIASRVLGPSGYGVVAAMLSLVVVLTIPAYSIQTVTAQEVGALRGREADTPEIAAAVRRRMRQALWIGAVASIALIAAAPFLDDALNISTPWPLVATGCAALPLLALAAARGAMQGLGRYGEFAASLVVESAGRLVVAIVALAAGFGATGVTVAPAAGSAIAALLGLWALRDLWRTPVATAPPAAHVVAVWATLAFFAGFSALTNIDVLIVKHAADAVAAGEYAGAAFFGKVVLLLPIGIGIILVPETAARRASGRPTGPILRVALLIAAGLCGLLIAAAYLAPKLVQTLTVGDEYPGVRELLGPYAVATSCMSAVALLVLYAVTIGRPRSAWLVLAAAPLQAGVMFAVRDSPHAVIWTMTATAAILIVCCAADLAATRPPRPVS